MKIILLEMSNLHISLLVVGITCLASIVGYMFVTQNATNKLFRDAVTEFRVAIAMLDQQNKSQNMICQQHRQSIADTTGQIRSDFHDLKERVDDHLLEAPKVRKLFVRTKKQTTK